VEQARQIIRIWATRIAVIVVVLLSVLLLLYAISLFFDESVWAVLKVLAVPITVGAAVPLLNRLQQKRELEIAERRANDEALQAYLDKMTDLLVTHRLHEPPANEDKLLSDPVRVVAWARTKTGLRRLDGEGKGRILRFLHEAGLIQKGCPRIHSLAKADLIKADLRESSLTGARLRGVHLREADLRGANLSGADLSGADLAKAKLRGANLNDADLSGAIVTREQLASCSLEGTTMPDGQVLEGPESPNGPTFTEWSKSKDRGEDGENSGSS
jgi:hypothetical protein